MAITKVSRGLLSTGISDSSDATAITIDSSENILLSNTTSLIGANTSDGSDNKSVMINGGGAASDSRGGYVWIKGNEYSSDAGFLQLNAGNVSGAGIKFFTSGSERARILSSGGITFNGDTADANALDDYEEGTWTPTIIGSSGVSGQSYSTQAGFYTRIGRFVHMTFDVRLSAKGTISGYVLLGGHGFTFLGNNIGGSLFTSYVTNVSNQDHYPIVGYAHQTLIYLMNPPTDYLGAGDINDNTILIGSILGHIA